MCIGNSSFASSLVHDLCLNLYVTPLHTHGQAGPSFCRVKAGWPGKRVCWLRGHKTDPKLWPSSWDFGSTLAPCWAPPGRVRGAFPEITRDFWKE